jgi:copper(I)-binding protein
MIGRIAAALALALALAACGGSTSSTAAPTPSVAIPTSDMHVIAATVTPDGQDADASFAIHNGTGSPDRLVGVSCTCATAAEIHGANDHGDIGPVTGVALPPDEVVTFAPGGPHIVLVGVTQPLDPGSTVTLTLRFAHAGPVDVVAAVKAPATPSVA